MLAVRPAGLGSGDDGWTDTLGGRVDPATRTLGNPVNRVEVSADELPQLLTRRRPSLWSTTVAEGIVFAGAPLLAAGTAG